MTERTFTLDQPLSPAEPEPRYQSAAERQEERMGEIPELYRRTHERLATELALHIEDADAIFERYGYSPEQAAELLEHKPFVMLLQHMTQEVQTNGLSFKTKAALIAGELLPYAHDLATDPLVSAAVRLDSVKWVSKMAGFEPTTKDEKQGAGGLTLSITFAGEAPKTIVSGREPITIEADQ